MAAFTIEPAPGVQVARAGGAVLAESTRALVLREEGRAPVVYFPRDDVAMVFFERSSTETVCPGKGRATHYNLVTRSRIIEDAAWSYEAPVAGAGAIAGHLAFYPDKVTVERL